jgi:hypothetical protein
LPRWKREISDQFNFQMRRLGPEAAFKDRDFIYELQEPEWKVKVDSGVIHELCQKAFEQPLKLAEKQIEYLSAISGQEIPTKGVVSGGSAKHACIKSQLEVYCSKYELPKPSYSHDITGILE